MIWINAAAAAATAMDHNRKIAVGYVLLLSALVGCTHAKQYPRITEHPMDVMVPRHDPVTLNCKADGSPTPAVQWFKDGEPLTTEPGSHRMVLPAGGLFFLKVVHSRRDSDSGVYWCEATNEMGTVRSHNATLQVAVLREEFRLEPTNTRVAQGETALMECGPPRGTPEPIVSWRKNGQTLDLSGSKRIRLVDGGNLAIQDARQGDDGRYQCIVRNPAGVRESSVAYLKVHVRPFLIRGPENQTSLVGTSVTFQCRVGGEPLPDVLWRRTASSGNMPLGRVHILEDRSLRLENVTLDDVGEYSCEADNAVGSVSATGSLYVHSPPKFSVRPKSQISELGKEAIFECHATGTPRPTVFWSIEGNRTLMFAGSRYGNIDIALTPEGRSVLSISRIQRTDSGTIIVCSAVNSVGSVSSRVVLAINTQEERPPPIILTGPVNQTLPLKSVAVLPCSAVGTPTPVISWYRDGIPVLKAAPRIAISETGTLTLNDLRKDEDAGLYTCVASSRSGKSTWSAYLKLEQPTNPNIKFFRAPDANALPSLPGKPQIVDKTSATVTLSWTRSGQIGASSVLGYSVEMFGRNDTDGWTTVATRLQNTTYTQEALTAGVTYYFVVRAENSHGVSSPSAMSEPIVVGLNEFNVALDLSEARASLMSGDVIELSNATSLEPTSMRLVWEIINGKYVEGFYIYARQLASAPDALVPYGAETYKMLTVLNGGGASTCTVNGLAAYTRYEFFVVPFYKSVEGKPSNSREARTIESVPTEAPTNMEAILMNATAVYLKWRQPAAHAQNGLLTTYSVIVRGISYAGNLSHVLTNISIDATTPSLLLANLTEGVTYTVSVAAANGAGLGPFTAPATLRLDPITKRLDQSVSPRYPIDMDDSADLLTQKWFIIMLGSVLSLMMLSFGAMVFVRRKQMFMKQSSLGSLGDTRLGFKMPGSSGHPNNAGTGGNGFWLDSSAGLIWRQGNDSGTMLGKQHIADYAPVCHPSSVVSQGTAAGTMDSCGREVADIGRFVGEYSNFQADYAEVSSFRGKAPSDCYDPDSTMDDGSQSPAPYATTTLVGGGGSAGGSTAGSRHAYRGNSSTAASHHNVFFGNDGHQQHFHLQQQQQQNQLYQAQSSQRSAYSDTYFTPGQHMHHSQQHHIQQQQHQQQQQQQQQQHRINITENKLSNMSALTDAGYGSHSSTATASVGGGTSSCSVPQTPLGTIRRSSNRLKLTCRMGANKLRTSLGDSDRNLANLSGSEANGSEQFYVKVGEMLPVHSSACATGGVSASASSSDVYMNWGQHQQEQQLLLKQQQQQQQSKHQLQQHAHFFDQQPTAAFMRPDASAANSSTSKQQHMTMPSASTAKADKDLLTYGAASTDGPAQTHSLISSYRSGRFEDV